MKHTLKAWFQAVVGLIAILVVHLPRLGWHLLQWSYSAAFQNRPNLTADPKEHLRRARRLLRSGKNSKLLYAALELRFALERSTHADLLNESISNKLRKKYQPTKKVRGLAKVETDSTKPHRTVLVNRDTGGRVEMGDFYPFDQARVAEIEGRLGDLLHPKVGLPLGVGDHAWYRDTRAFLWDTYRYLNEVLDGRSSFLSDKGLYDEWDLRREPLE
jgi:hypothetical protein